MNKKVLLLQENGRHKDNQNYRECFSLQRAFNYNNFDADIWGLGHSNYSDTPNWELYDLIINLENYDEQNWIPNLEKTKKPIKCLWSIDAHCRGEFIYEQTFNIGKYDYILHSTKDFVTKPYHIWFPNAYDDDLIKPLNIEKTIDFGFCGNYVNRKSILHFLKDNYNLVLDIFVIGNDMVKAVNSYKCHFNKNIANDINYRSFETIGCGTVLLTNYNPQYIELGFEHGKNCFLYNSIDELIYLIDFIKKSDILTMKNNIIELAKEHTYKKRVKKLIDQIYE